MTAVLGDTGAAMRLVNRKAEHSFEFDGCRSNFLLVRCTANHIPNTTNTTNLGSGNTGEIWTGSDILMSSRFEKRQVRDTPMVTYLYRVLSNYDKFYND